MAEGTLSSMSGVVVGVYGVQGVGKSHVLTQIGADRIEWRIADGSQLIKEVLDARGQTMEQFNDIPPEDKAAVRRSAIEMAKSKPGVSLIAGHGSFPAKSGGGFDDVFTPADGEAYDMIIYIHKDPEKVVDQVKNDVQRVRTEHSLDTVQSWMDHEKKLLEVKCAEYGIVFDTLCLDGQNGYRDLVRLILDGVVHAYVEASRAASERALIAAASSIPEADVYLLIDGDGTICPQDTGMLFYQHVGECVDSEPLKAIFQRYDSYKFQGMMAFCC